MKIDHREAGHMIIAAFDNGPTAGVTVQSAQSFRC